MFFIRNVTFNDRFTANFIRICFIFRDMLFGLNGLKVELANMDEFREL